MEEQKYYTALEVASALHVTPQTVRAYVKSGRIRAQRIGRTILITEDNLREFLQPSPATPPSATSINITLQK